MPFSPSELAKHRCWKMFSTTKRISVSKDLNRYYTKTVNAARNIIDLWPSKVWYAPGFFVVSELGSAGSDISTKIREEFMKIV